jgi:hypothetical protein
MTRPCGQCDIDQLVRATALQEAFGKSAAKVSTKELPDF